MHPKKENNSNQHENIFHAPKPKENLSATKVCSQGHVLILLYCGPLLGKFIFNPGYMDVYIIGA